MLIAVQAHRKRPSPLWQTRDDRGPSSRRSARSQMRQRHHTSSVAKVNVRAFYVMALLPFLVGFDDTAASESAEPVTVNNADLFPRGQLFHPPPANPKEPRTHVTYLRLRLPGDHINLASIGFGDSFGLVRWPGWGEEDNWQLSISGAVLAQFNLDTRSTDLINADYIVGLPLSYRRGPWSMRARLFHQSSHLGDELLLVPQRPELKVTRINLSFETLELLGAWDWHAFQLTAGPSYILRTDSNLKRRSIQAGLSYYSAAPTSTSTLRPFGSILYHAWDETNWHADFNLRAGVSIRSPYAEKRAVHVFVEHFRGSLPFGQFYKLRTQYYGTGIDVLF